MRLEDTMKQDDRPGGHGRRDDRLRPAAKRTRPPPERDHARRAGPARRSRHARRGRDRAGSRADYLAKAVPTDPVYFDSDDYSLDGEDRRRSTPRPTGWPAIPTSASPSRALRRARHPRIQPRAGRPARQCGDDFLQSRGVAAGRLVVTLAGARSARSRGSNESAWAQNRRAVTVILFLLAGDGHHAQHDGGN